MTRKASRGGNTHQEARTQKPVGQIPRSDGHLSPTPPAGTDWSSERDEEGGQSNHDGLKSCWNYSKAHHEVLSEHRGEGRMRWRRVLTCTSFPTRGPCS